MADNKPKPFPELQREEIDAFNAQIDKRGPDDCWPWTGKLTSKGYGRARFRGRNGEPAFDTGAHREDDSNVRPADYETAALPTAPPRCKKSDYHETLSGGTGTANW